MCEFTVTSSCVPTEPGMEISCSDGLDNDCDGLIDGADPDCMVCTPTGQSCVRNSDCCSGNCSNGRPSIRMCQP